MAATTKVKFAAAFRASVPLGSAGIRAGCIAPIALPTGTLIRPLEAVSATRLNESPLHFGANLFTTVNRQTRLHLHSV